MSLETALEILYATAAVCTVAEFALEARRTCKDYKRKDGVDKKK
ncbi:hypothetical protein [Gordonibacter sp. 28C]|nr:hypothetical protein [Gordonibacter sp. 28C]